MYLYITGHAPLTFKSGVYVKTKYYLLMENIGTYLRDHNVLKGVWNPPTHIWLIVMALFVVGYD